MGTVALAHPWTSILTGIDWQEHRPGHDGDH
jgi:hypothetical protein